MRRCACSILPASIPRYWSPADAGNRNLDVEFACWSIVPLMLVRRGSPAVFRAIYADARPCFASAPDAGRLPRVAGFSKLNL